MSLFLICALRTVLDAVETPTRSPEAATRVWTRHATGLANVMPISYRERIRRIPGVEQAIATDWFGGIYKDPAIFFAQFAVDADHFFEVYPEIKTEAPEQQAEFVKLRTASLAGVNLAKRFGWKVGDRITLQGTFYPVDPETTLVGFISGGGYESTFLFHWDYLNELSKQDITGGLVVKAKNAEDIPAVSEAIDAMFVNTSAPTKTETEAAFYLSLMSMYGNVRTLIVSISTVVLFAVILVAANTMAMSIRERTAEVGILKTLGFSPAQILTMIIAEGALIAVTGGLLGAIGARLVLGAFNLAEYTTGFIETLNVRGETILLSVIISLAVAFISTLIPAFTASRLPIAVAIRRR